jgi:hypothetical protein
MTGGFKLYHYRNARHNCYDREIGSEIFIPVIIGLKWGLVVFVCLGLIYIAIFRFRNSSIICRKVLRSILFVFGAMLFAASASCALFILGLLFALLTAQIDPPSDRYTLLSVAISVGAGVAGGWWCLSA